MSGSGDPAGDAGEDAETGTDPTSEATETQNGELQPGADEADADAAGARQHGQDLEDHTEPT